MYQSQGELELAGDQPAALRSAALYNNKDYPNHRSRTNAPQPGGVYRHRHRLQLGQLRNTYGAQRQPQFQHAVRRVVRDRVARLQGGRHLHAPWAWTSSDVVNNGMTLQLHNGVPTPGDRVRDAADVLRDPGRELGLFAQDQWTLKRLTINAGVRFDALDDIVPAQTIGPGPQVPTRNISFDAVRQRAELEGRDAAPRRRLRPVRQRQDRRQGQRRQGTWKPESADLTASGQSGRRDRPERDAHLDRSQQRLRPAGRRARRDQPDELRHTNVSTPLRRDVLTSRGYNWEVSAQVQHELVPRVVAERRLLPALVRQLDRDGEPALTPADYSPTASRRRSMRGCPAAAATRCAGSTTSTGFGQNNLISVGVDLWQPARIFNGVDLA